MRFEPEIVLELLGRHTDDALAERDAEIERLRTQVTDLTEAALLGAAALRHAEVGREQWRADANRERARAERLAAALEFYGDRENWEVQDGILTLAAGIEIETNDIPAMLDRGDHARQALAEGRDG